MEERITDKTRSTIYPMYLYLFHKKVKKRLVLNFYNKLIIYCLGSIFLFFSVASISAQNSGQEAICINCNTIAQIRWSPVNNTLAVASSNGLNLYQVTGELIITLSEDGTDAISWSPDGSLLASWQSSSFLNGTSYIQIWSISDYQLQTELSASTSWPVFEWSPTQNILAFSNGYSLNLWEPDTGELTEAKGLEFTELPESPTMSWSTPRSMGAFQQLHWSPDGSLIFLSIREGISGYETNGSNRLRTGSVIWNIGDERIEESFSVYPDRWDNVTWMPNTSNLLVMQGPRGHFLLNVLNGDVSALNIPTSSLAAWSPDGSSLATNPGFDGEIWLWDTKNWLVFSTLYGHADEVTTLDWSFDGTYLASGSQDGTVRIWEY